MFRHSCCRWCVDGASFVDVYNRFDVFHCVAIGVVVLMPVLGCWLVVYQIQFVVCAHWSIRRYVLCNVVVNNIQLKHVIFHMCHKGHGKLFNAMFVRAYAGLVLFQVAW